MKKQTLWLLLIGGLFTSITFFTSSFINMPDSTRDFMKGFGVALIVGALFLQGKSKKERSDAA
jgi:O-antigen/teichoic acid export membrane protein